MPKSHGQLLVPVHPEGRIYSQGGVAAFTLCSYFIIYYFLLIICIVYLLWGLP